MDGFLDQAGRIQEALARLKAEHKKLAREPGKPFDWIAHKKHRLELAQLKSLILEFRATRAAGRK